MKEIFKECSVSLLDLPGPGERTGWPWTEESVRPVDLSVNESPSITIVMPSFNQGRFLEEAIRSVLLQKYPRVELSVMDGGSTDESAEILRRYTPFLAHWVSERDRGQSDAINKGLAQANGTLFNWLNSDDLLLPGALWALARASRKGEVDLIAGRCKVMDESSGECLQHWTPRAPSHPSDFFASGGVVLPQPSTFIATHRLHAIQGVNEDLHYVMDWEMYLRLSLSAPPLRCREVPETLSISRSHPATKTSLHSGAFRQEAIASLQRIRQPLGMIGRYRWLRWKRLLELQERLASAIDRKNRRLLWGTPLRYPESLMGRPFWGAFFRINGWKKS